MKIRQLFVFSLLGLALAGCHSDPEIAYLQRDNLNKQRKIEQLQNRIEDLEEARNSVAPVQATITRGVSPAAHTMEGDQYGPARTYPAAPPFAPPAPPATPPARTYSEPDAPGSGLPPIKIDGGQLIPPVNPASGGSSQWSPAGGQPLAGVSARSDNGSVAQITLHPALTGGIGTGGHPSDEGLLVVVEPRDFGGNIINVPGNISVALLDPALTGEQARLARWDFAATETQGMIRTGSQPGIHLRLPWTSTPAHDRLKVFVRYTTRDGRKLQAERLIGVALNGPPPARRDDLPDAESAQTAARPQRPQWSPVR